MANGEEKNKGKDFYAVLGLDMKCSDTELRNAYKKLAMRWHPDRCSASGNSKFVEEAKKKFQAIQQAYSVLSDSNKRLLYDVGAYDSDDEDNEMGDFLNEMVAMMSETKPNENGEESFEELQELFEEMFHGDIDSFGASCQTTTSYCESSNPSNKRGSFGMNLKTKVEEPLGFYQFCLGVALHGILSISVNLVSGTNLSKLEEERENYDAALFFIQLKNTAFKLYTGGTPALRLEKGERSKQKNSRRR